MKKKVLSMLLTAVVAGSLLAGCGGSSAAAPVQEAPAEEATEAAAEETEEKEEVAEEAAEETAEEAGEEAAEEEKPSATVGDGSAGDIKVWVADAVVDFTAKEIEKFFEANPDYAGYKVTVEAVGEGDAAGNMITDVEAGADIYAFPQDQIARLVAAGALETVNPDVLDAVKSENDEGSIKAATVGSELYAYPLTSDNGYFLYYDKSVVSDPSSLETILADCEAAGKSFYMEINSGWYQTAFFFATGCDLSYETDNDGNFTKANVTYASENGLNALKAMIGLNESKAFQNGSAIGEATNLAAIVDGTWDSSAAQEVFGDNYACAKLPTFKDASGKEYQMSGFGGFKLLGVKPQTEEDKLAVCDALAYYLAGGEVQIDRYKEVGWGPSNIEAQNSEDVKSDAALTALAEQLTYTIPQGQYPGDYWTLATSLGDSVRNGELSSSSSDDELMDALSKFQESCESYVQ
ncbi:MAG: extracellular solute-binding protein [Lachnospiraceae bacterium]|nr:extracellular solute-binding protein [Lachnospiraceae bacterium]